VSIFIVPAAPPLVTSVHPDGSVSLSSNERFRTISAYSPPSPARLISSKKIPYSVGLTLWPGWSARTVTDAAGAVVGSAAEDADARQSENSAATSPT
jgi:hypothetical protein